MTMEHVAKALKKRSLRPYHILSPKNNIRGSNNLKSTRFSPMVWTSGARIVKNLFELCKWCQWMSDVYMYLTPPHSGSYNLLMSWVEPFIFMVVTWRFQNLGVFCHVTSWMAPFWYPLIRSRVPTKQKMEVVRWSCNRGQKLVQTSLYSPPCLFDPIAIPSYSPHLISINLCEHLKKPWLFGLNKGLCLYSSLF